MYIPTTEELNSVISSINLEELQEILERKLIDFKTIESRKFY